MDGYHIYEQIGAGARSTIYKARQKKTLNYFAVKRTPKSQAGPTLAKEVAAQALAHAAAQQHQDVIPIRVLRLHAWYSTPRSVYRVVDYCAGASLAAVVEQDNGLPDAAARLFGIDLLLAVLQCHLAGVLVCDLRPAGVLLEEDGTLKLSDFGSARLCNDPLELPEVTLATVAYMAPELLLPPSRERKEQWGEGEEEEQQPSQALIHTRASDLWSFGVTLYELATGERPFQGATQEEIAHAIVKTDPQPPRVPTLVQRKHSAKGTSAAGPASAGSGDKNGDGDEGQEEDHHDNDDEEEAEFGSNRPAPRVNASPALSNLLTGLLDKEPKTRMTWEEVVSHPFWRVPNVGSLPPELVAASSFLCTLPEEIHAMLRANAAIGEQEGKERSVNSSVRASTASLPSLRASVPKFGGEWKENEDEGEGKENSFDAEDHDDAGAIDARAESKNQIAGEAMPLRYSGTHAYLRESTGGGGVAAGPAAAGAGGRRAGNSSSAAEASDSSKNTSADARTSHEFSPTRGQDALGGFLATLPSFEASVTSAPDAKQLLQLLIHPGDDAVTVIASAAASGRAPPLRPLVLPFHCPTAAALLEEEGEGGSGAIDSHLSAIYRCMAAAAAAADASASSPVDPASIQLAALSHLYSLSDSDALSNAILNSNLSFLLIQLASSSSPSPSSSLAVQARSALTLGRLIQRATFLAPSVVYGERGLAVRLAACIDMEAASSLGGGGSGGPPRHVITHPTTRQHAAAAFGELFFFIATQMAQESADAAGGYHENQEETRQWHLPFFLVPFLRRNVKAFTQPDALVRLSLLNALCNVATLAPVVVPLLDDVTESSSFPLVLVRELRCELEVAAAAAGAEESDAAASPLSSNLLPLVRALILLVAAHVDQFTLISTSMCEEVLACLLLLVMVRGGGGGGGEEGGGATTIARPLPLRAGITSRLCALAAFVLGVGDISSITPAVLLEVSSHCSAIMRAVVAAEKGAARSPPSSSSSSSSSAAEGTASAALLTGVIAHVACGALAMDTFVPLLGEASAASAAAASLLIASRGGEKENDASAGSATHLDTHGGSEEMERSKYQLDCGRILLGGVLAGAAAASAALSSSPADEEGGEAETASSPAHAEAAFLLQVTSDVLLAVPRAHLARAIPPSFVEQLAAAVSQSSASIVGGAGSAALLATCSAAVAVLGALDDETAADEDDDGESKAREVVDIAVLHRQQLSELRDIAASTLLPELLRCLSPTVVRQAMASSSSSAGDDVVSAAQEEVFWPILQALYQALNASPILARGDAGYLSEILQEDLVPGLCVLLRRGSSSSNSSSSSIGTADIMLRGSSLELILAALRVRAGMETTTSSTQPSSNAFAPLVPQGCSRDALAAATATLLLSSTTTSSEASLCLRIIACEVDAAGRAWMFHGDSMSRADAVAPALLAAGEWAAAHGGDKGGEDALRCVFDAASVLARAALHAGLVDGDRTAAARLAVARKDVEERGGRVRVGRGRVDLDTSAASTATAEGDGNAFPDADATLGANITSSGRLDASYVAEYSASDDIMNLSAEEVVADALSTLTPLAIICLLRSEELNRSIRSSASGEGYQRMGEDLASDVSSSSSLSSSGSSFLLLACKLAPVKVAFHALFWSDATAKHWKDVSNGLARQFDDAGDGDAATPLPSQPLVGLLEVLSKASATTTSSSTFPPSVAANCLRAAVALVAASQDIANAIKKAVASSSSSSALRDLASSLRKAAAATASSPPPPPAPSAASVRASAASMPPSGGGPIVVRVRVKSRANGSNAVQEQSGRRAPEVAQAASVLLSLLDM